jgi:hypothetical protein
MCTSYFSSFLIYALMFLPSSALYALCLISILCPMPLLCVSTLSHIMLLLISINLNRRNHLFSVLHLFIMLSPLSSHTLDSSSSLVIMLSMFFISVYYAEILQLLWPLCRDSSASLAVTVFDAFPSINCLDDESSFHWSLPRDSSASLVISPKLL